MHRLLVALLLAATLAPSTAFALDETPLPVPLPAIACPAPEIGPDGVVVVPPDAPADCAYLSGLPGIETGCIPPESIGSDPDLGALPVCMFVPASGPDGSCVVASDGTSTCDDPGPTDLPQTGRHFAITAVNLSGVGYELMNTGALHIGADGSLRATIGCNEFRGRVEVTDDGGFAVVGPLAQTKMFCPDLMEIEQLFSDILLDGRLTVDRSGAQLIAWDGFGTLALIEVMQDQGPTDLPSSTRYELRAVLLADGRRYEIENGYLLITEGVLTASAGCNTIGGAVATIDGALVVGDLIATEMWCEGRMDAEAALITVLTGGELRFTGLGGVSIVSATGSLELATGDTPVDDTTGGSARGELAVLLLLLPALAGACALVIGLTGTPRREA